MVHVPRSVVHLGGLSDNQKGPKYFHWDLVVKNNIPLVTVTQVFLLDLQHQNPYF